MHSVDFTSISNASDSVEAEKPRSKRILEPLTWDEMVSIDRPKLTVAEKVPLMKWYNPKLN